MVRLNAPLIARLGLPALIVTLARLFRGVAEGMTQAAVLLDFARFSVLAGLSRSLVPSQR
jgi:ribose/xylose/arabinose/galactoside ABC-type transport system permease subunit